jgi:hypothetical protein
MSDRLAIELPSDVTAEDQDAIVASLRELEEVEQAENLGPSRSVDLETISVGVQLAGQIGALIGPVVSKIINIVRGRRIKGVHLSLPDGTTLAVDEISPDDLDRLLAHIRT